MQPAFNDAVPLVVHLSYNRQSRYLDNVADDMADSVSVSWTDLLRGIGAEFSEDRVHVDKDAVKQLLSSYSSNREDWQPFAKFDAHRYTRNLVDEGNGRYNLLVLCWGEGHASPIHDHANSDCFMKILEGSLQEVQYTSPETGNQPLTYLRTQDIDKNEVTHINDSIGLHLIQNTSHTDPAVSLHLYIPPITVCHTYDQHTGHANSSTMSFYSRNGTLSSNYSMDM